jgi:Putative GTPases (G3E family)
MKKKIDIFSGFLGAGKTRLIKKLIDEKFSDEKIVVIENEFGEIGIDGSFLDKYDIEIKEITAGCICCSILGDFKNALNDIINQEGVERIIIEPSGVGKLSEIIKVVKELEATNEIFLNIVITVVDITMYEDFVDFFSEFYKNQIAYADTIVLSRTQHVDYEKIKSVISEIKQINNRASIITTAWDKVSGDKIVAVGESYEGLDLFKKRNIINKLPEGVKFKVRKSESATDVFISWGLETPKIFNIEKLKSIFNEIKNEDLYGKVIRSKGIVQVDEESWIEFDYVPKDFQIRDTAPDYTGRICVIGTELNEENLTNLFNN